MHSKLLSSQFPSEIDSYKPPLQYLYFSSYKQWACSACIIFSLFASVHFRPCLQEINLLTFILAENSSFCEKRFTNGSHFKSSEMLSTFAHWYVENYADVKTKRNWCPLRSQMRAKLAAHSKTDFAVNGAALRRGTHRITSCECALGFETRSANRLDEEIKPCYS